MFVSRAPHDDYSPAMLQTINDSLYLNVFDEYLTDISQVMFSSLNIVLIYLDTVQCTLDAAFECRVLKLGCLKLFSLS